MSGRCLFLLCPAICRCWPFRLLATHRLADGNRILNVRDPKQLVFVANCAGLCSHFWPILQTIPANERPHRFLKNAEIKTEKRKNSVSIWLTVSVIQQLTSIRTDHRNSLFINDSAGQQMEIKFGAINNDCVAGIVSALKRKENRT